MILQSAQYILSVNRFISEKSEELPEGSDKEPQILLSDLSVFFQIFQFVIFSDVSDFLSDFSVKYIQNFLNSPNILMISSFNLHNFSVSTVTLS